jgi:hypothetical protein
VTIRPGLVLAAVVLCIYGTLSLAVSFPRAAYGFHSDEATYYMMAYSLVDDHDLAYRHDDLVRVWKEFPSGPVGVFLKKGRILTGGDTSTARRSFIRSSPRLSSRSSARTASSCCTRSCWRWWCCAGTSSSTRAPPHGPPRSSPPVS